MPTHGNWLSLTDPLTGDPLHYFANPKFKDVGVWQAKRGGTQWPAIWGIPYLRASRSDLALACSRLIATGDMTEALALLLQDTDDFAPAKPTLDASRSVAQALLQNSPALSGREVMETLAYGPVADYFALRGSTPTFFSGIGLLKAGHRAKRPVVEVACGAGHFLYWMRARGIPAIGIDAVFSKLCLAHKFLGLSGDHLICAEAGSDAGLPISMHTPASVFCHDAIYFFQQKATALDDFRRIAGPDGSLLIGHAHLSSANHGAVSGYPLSVSNYRRLATHAARFFDDATLAQTGVHGGILDDAIPETAEAVSFIEGVTAHSIAAGVWPDGEYLHAPLPLWWNSSSCTTIMDWPDEAFRTEYADADYLFTSENPALHMPCVADPQTPRIHPGLTLPAAFLRLGCRPLRWGVIGGGWIAADYFAPAFQWLPHADLVALAEPHPGRRAAFAAIVPVETFSEWQEMLDHCSLDAVYIATPNDTHADLVEALAHRGIRILCEKPLATNDSDLERIRSAAEASPAHFQTAFDQRFHPAHGQIAKLIARGDFGTITRVYIHYACWVGDDWSKVPDTENWRIDPRRAGGGAGFDLLPHCLDLIQMLLNDPIETMHLLYQHRAHAYAIEEGGVDDGALMSIRTRGGVLVSVSVGYNCPEDQPRRSITIAGTSGWLEAINTMGQDPGGEIRFESNGQRGTMAFPNRTLHGPFLRQLDSVSRVWINHREPDFPFSADLALADQLIRQDREANPPEETA
jgi:predicted dehydrogenase/SAM-dependent methyltransferase